jgi:hypothetical protein
VIIIVISRIFWHPFYLRTSRCFLFRQQNLDNNTICVSALQHMFCAMNATDQVVGGVSDVSSAYYSQLLSSTHSIGAKRDVDDKTEDQHAATHVKDHSRGRKKRKIDLLTEGLFAQKLGENQM